MISGSDEFSIYNALFPEDPITPPIDSPDQEFINDITPPVVYHDKFIIVRPKYDYVLYFYDIKKQNYVLKCELDYFI